MRMRAHRLAIRPNVFSFTELHGEDLPRFGQFVYLEYHRDTDLNYIEVHGAKFNWNTLSSAEQQAHLAIPPHQWLLWSSKDIQVTFRRYSTQDRNVTQEHLRERF